MPSPSGHDQGAHSVITPDLWRKQAFPPGSPREFAFLLLLRGQLDINVYPEQWRDLMNHAEDLRIALHQLGGIHG